MATDIIFHPLVFYFTGNYHHHDADKRRLAQARHRMFEVYLDSWMKANIDYPVPTHLSDLRRQAGEHFAVLPRFLGAALPFGDKPAAASHELWKGSLSALILFQMLFTNDFVGAIFRGLGKTFPRKLAGIDALFSFGRRSPEDFFNGQLEFVNPLDNEKYTASMHELLSAAVQKMLIWLKNLEPLVGGDHSDVDAALGKIQGESLNFGRYRVSAEEMKYFAEAGANLPGLKIPPTESGDSK